MIAAPDSAKRGIYVSAFADSSILGFRTNYKTGRGPMCTIYTGEAGTNAIATDSSGNLVVPEGNFGTVVVYGGPNMCGTELGQFQDQYGQAAAAATLNAATGTIAIADLKGPVKPVGNVALCTLKSGCAQVLTNSNITGYVGGIAMAKNGDCWAVSENSSFTATALTYWLGCTGPGQAATGFKNNYYGSLSVDKQGNLVAVDFLGGGSGQLWVYSGCNPACTLVGGPFPLEGQPLFGALNAKGDTFGTMEVEFPYGGRVDIYAYTPTKLTYEYSFDSGYAPVAQPEGFAYSPALPE